MRSNKIGVRLKDALEAYREYIDEWYVEKDFYGPEHSPFSIWIHMKSGYFHPMNESSIVHEHDQRDAYRKLQEMVSEMQSRGVLYTEQNIAKIYKDAFEIAD